MGHRAALSSIGPRRLVAVGLCTCVESGGLLRHPCAELDDGSWVLFRLVEIVQLSWLLKSLLVIGPADGCLIRPLHENTSTNERCA